MNVFSLLDNAFESIVESGNRLLDGEALTTSILPTVDLDDVLTDVTGFVNDAIADVDQVIEATTQQVITALGDTDVAVDTVDVSAVVENLVNAVASLPEGATIDSLLSDLEVSFLSDEQLSDLVDDVSNLVDNIAPNLSQLELQPLLDQGVDFLDDLPNGVGTIAIDGSTLSGELTLDGVVRTFTTDVSDDIDSLVTNVSDFLSEITGSANLSNGQFTGDVTIGDTQYGLNLDVTDTVTNSLLTAFTSIDTPISFTNGVVDLQIDTVFGDIDGTLNFAGGDLDVDLETPFGDLSTSFAFPENAQFDVPVELVTPLDLEIDLAAGVVSVPLLGGLDIPLETFSGEVNFNDTSAVLSLDLGLPTPVESTFEIGPLAEFVATELVEDFSGDLTLDAGVLDGTIASRFGDLPVTAALSDAVLQAAAVIDQTTGQLTLNDGIAGISFDTPFGELLGNLALSPVEDAVASVSNSLA